MRSRKGESSFSMPAVRLTVHKTVELYLLPLQNPTPPTLEAEHEALNTREHVGNLLLLVSKRNARFDDAFTV